MIESYELVPTIYDGWHTYQQVMIAAISVLNLEHLNLRAAPNLRSVGTITAHIIGARACWFYLLMGEGGDEFKALGKWDHRGAKARSAEELISGLEVTWKVIHERIARWTAEDWEKSWPGEDSSEPEMITRQWVIWHLIEHDLHHGGEISITLGAHGIPRVGL